MGILKQTFQKQIDSRNLQYVNSSTATVLKYYPDSNTAGISYPHPSGNGKLYIDHVPISNSLGGLTSNGIKPGQSCTVTFINSNPNAPLITGVNDGNYNEKTCTDQGAFIIDESIREQVDTSIQIEPMYSDWLDENNTWPNKYINDINYSDVDTTISSIKIKNSIDRFDQSEVGLTNLATKATLKMKNNGDIDIFVSDNVGIRISKSMHKIYLYGFDVSINGEIDLLPALTRCLNCEFKGYLDETKKNSLKESINKYISDIEEDIEELKKCIEYTKEITGDISYFTDLDDAISKFETLKKKYNEGKYDDTIEDLQDANEQMINYYEYFEEELVAARQRWGLV